MKPRKQASHALGVVRKFYPTVTKVVDAKKSLKVEVTKRDTSLATVKKHEDCAFAVACKRKTRARGVIISMSTAYLVKGKVATRFKVPSAVSREIVSFDRKAGFASGFYKLNAPTPSTKLGYKGGSTPETNKKKIIHRHITADVREHLKA